MTILGWVVVITTFAGVIGTGLGGAIGAIFNKNSSKTVSLLLSFAGGVMLSIVCFDLLVDAINPSDGYKVNIFIVIAGVIAGFMLIYLLNIFIDKSTNKEVKHIGRDHPKTADNLDELIHSDHLAAHQSKHSGLFVAGIVMALAIALHNLPEGMVIGASYANDSGTIFAGSGFIIALILAVHNIPEGMAVSVPLISGGMKKWQAICVTALSGSPTILGAILGYYLGGMGPLALSLSLAFASGAMLYVVFGELLPEAILMCRSKVPSIAIMAGIFLGLILIYV
ncbi:MAG: ZIP family metal transporter [Clostridia bacterium]